MAFFETEPKLPSPSDAPEAGVELELVKMGNQGVRDQIIHDRLLFKDVHCSLDHLFGGAYRGDIELIRPRSAHEIDHFLDWIDGGICHVPDLSASG